MIAAYTFRPAALFGAAMDSAAIEPLLLAIEQDLSAACINQGMSTTALREHARRALGLASTATLLQKRVDQQLAHHEDAERPWAEALAAYQAARAADEGKSSDAALEARRAARDRLIEAVDAPDGLALAYKMRLAFEYSAGFEGLIRDWDKVLIADAERLGAAA